jgi:hypothetical protein
MEYKYVVRQCDRPYGAPPLWGIFEFGAQRTNEPKYSSEDRGAMEDLCEQMNNDDNQSGAE